MRDISKLENSTLVDKMAELNKKMEKLKESYNAYAAELQRRACETFEETNTKFARYKSEDFAVEVTNKGSLDIVSVGALKRIIGDELFDTEFTMKKEINFKAKKPFEDTLKSICTEDYDFNTPMSSVYDALGADESQRAVLDKKLKGDYSKDYSVIASLFGEGDYDTELYCIHKIFNANRIKVFFPDCTDDFLDSMRKCMFVKESLSVAMK